MEIDKNGHDKFNLRLQVVEISRLNSQRLEVSATDLSKSSSDNRRQQVKNDAEVQSHTKIVIEGVWAQCHISKHSIIHLIDPNFDTNSQAYSVTNSRGFLVLEPDNLLTCTLVASSLFCERKTWLNHVFLGQVGTNRAMLVGTLVHEVFQYGVKNKIADTDRLTKFLDELLDDATVMLEIYSVELHLNDIRAEAIGYIGSVKEWIEKYMFSGPRYPLSNDPDLEVKLIGVTDIEENVWSTKYGLKGKIDVTGSVRIYDKRTRSLKDKTIPLELKTGNPNLSSSHSAQVSLYSMMIEDRYSETNQGFVIYLKNKAAMHNVCLTHNIKRDLIQRRNQISHHMKSFYFGPDMIDQTRMCKNCERLTECVLMSQLYKPGDINHFPSMKSLESEAVGHLDQRLKVFFQNYHEKLVARLMKADANSFWTYSSQEAEANGTGFSMLQAFISKENPGLITFRRHPEHVKQVKSEPTNNKGTLNNGGDTLPRIKKQRIEDYFKPVVKVSSELKSSRGRPFDTNFKATRTRVAISLDEKTNNMDDQNSTTAIAIGFINDIKDDHFVMKLYEGTLNPLKPDLMYRVDRIEKRMQLDVERTVLVRLLAREDWRCDRVRQLLLDPRFVPEEDMELNLFVLSTGFEEISQLDAKHQKFVVEAISTDNYYILNEAIEPKKSKIHKIISILSKVIYNLGRKVLIVGQNIDHLTDLMKLLQNQKIRFVLIDDGKSVKARYQFGSNLVKVYQGENLDLSKKYDAYLRQFELAPIIITSYAMSIGGLLFTRKTFDYCVAYDCDTTELLMGLSPLFCSDRHILIDVREEDKTAATAETQPCEDVTLGDHLRSLRATSANNDRLP